MTEPILHLEEIADYIADLLKQVKQLKRDVRLLQRTDELEIGESPDDVGGSLGGGTASEFLTPIIRVTSIVDSTQILGRRQRPIDDAVGWGDDSDFSNFLQIFVPPNIPTPVTDDILAVRFTGNFQQFTDGTTLTLPRYGLFAAALHPTARCRVALTANQTIPDFTATLVSFADAVSVEVYDTNDFHEGVTNPSRLTIPEDANGVYQIFAHLRWAANSTGTRRIDLTARDSDDALKEFTFTEVDALTAPSRTHQDAAGVWELVAGDYVELRALHTSGGNLDLVGGPVAGGATCELTIVRIGQ